MAVCFFDDNYDESYECDYTVKKYNIEVIVNYEIDKEIEPDNNGVKSFGLNTKFKERSKTIDIKICVTSCPPPTFLSSSLLGSTK